MKQNTPKTCEERVLMELLDAEQTNKELTIKMEEQRNAHEKIETELKEQLLKEQEKSSSLIALIRAIGVSYGSSGDFIRGTEYIFKSDCDYEAHSETLNQYILNDATINLDGGNN